MTFKMDDKFSKSSQIQLNWLKVMELMEECIFHKRHQERVQHRTALVGATHSYIPVGALQ